MTEINAVYKCQECGSVLEVCAPGAAPVCCGAPMRLMKENTSDGAKEKHVPVIEQCGNSIKVKVGSVAHPMTEEHYIMWIEVIDGDMLYRKRLAPGDAPEACFDIPFKDTLCVREYCNLHGLWRK
ncbi:MAG: desulfoferrodoxin [Lentisphaeria bacterium]|nr:desulfoferrodoxin [Lentisphaeria bacterium]MBQ7396378.1 desulfoferrodoxin [Lentisphaeria bacterium]